MIKAISFDLDGTIADFEFNNAFFIDILPEIYAKKNKISTEAARKHVIDEYKEMGMDDIRWYSPRFWFERFGGRNFPEVVSGLGPKIMIYPDALPAIKELNKKFVLIVTSSSIKDFIDVKLERSGMKKYFYKVYSSLDDFNSLKTPEMYKSIARELKVKSSEILHVGDDPRYDYLNPVSVGMQALNIRRNDIPAHVEYTDNDKVPEDHVIKNLRELTKKIQELGL